MFFEKTSRKVMTFNLNDTEELAAYNRVLQDPGVKVIDKQLVPQEESHFEKDFSEKRTNHVVILEIEECSL